MNTAFVIRELGRLVAILSVFLTVVALWNIWFGQGVGDVVGADSGVTAALSAAAGVGFVLGGTMFFAARRARPVLSSREAMLLVALSWLVGAGLAGLPYHLWAIGSDWASSGHVFRSFAACYFEAMSGLTTTGSSVLSDIEALPRGLLLWRGLTQWLGGGGIVVLFVAVLPMIGVGGKKLFQAEAAGPTHQGVRPRIRETARMLWIIYVGLTILQTLLLRVFGMSWFDAANHTFATLATGGFSTRNASVAYYDSWAIDLTIIAFMFLGGVNFGLYYHAMRGRLRLVWKDPELRLYTAIVVGSAAIVSASLIGVRIETTAGTAVEPSIAAAIRYGLFNTLSIQTTTGFATADFDRWGFFAKAVLVTVMFVGGSAGSTAGGIKIIRILIVFKVLYAEIDRAFRPYVVQSVKVGRAPIDPELRLATMSFMVMLVGLSLLGGMLLMFFERSQGIDFTTAATAAATTINMTGPGLAAVGPVKNFGWFSAPSLGVMSVLMVLGRLELFAILVLLRRRFWQGE